MLPCPVCGHHVRSPSDPKEAVSCVFCGSVAPLGRATAAVVLLGLGLQACGGTSVPLYGTAITDTTAEETADTGDTGTE